MKDREQFRVVIGSISDSAHWSGYIQLIALVIEEGGLDYLFVTVVAKSSVQSVA